MSIKLNPGTMSFTPTMDINSQSFYPLNRITPTMDINSQSFFPQSNRNSAAKTMQKLYRGNNTRKKMTQKKTSSI